MFLSNDIQKQVRRELTSVRSQTNSIPPNSKGGGMNGCGGAYKHTNASAGLLLLTSSPTLISLLLMGFPPPATQRRDYFHCSIIK